jgi:hypothetical protein
MMQVRLARRAAANSLRLFCINDVARGFDTLLLLCRKTREISWDVWAGITTRVGGGCTSERRIPGSWL